MAACCKAYKMKDVFQTDDWRDKLHDAWIETSDTDICYIWNDFTVSKSFLKGEDVLFDSITPQWQEFCLLSLKLVQSDNSYRPIENVPRDIYEITQEKISCSQTNLPLTSGQWWCTEELEATHPRYGGVTMTITFNNNPHPVSLERTIQALVNHHDALRLRVTQKGGIWQQYISPAHENLPFTWIDLSIVSSKEQSTIIKSISHKIYKHINKLEEPLFHVIYLSFGLQEKGYILWISSHFVMDAVSVYILHHDFMKIYTQICQGTEICPLPQTTSFAEWTQHIQTYLHSHKAQKEIEEYWLSLPWKKVQRLPLDFPEGVFLDRASLRSCYGTEASSKHIIVALSIQETQALLTQVLDADTKIMDLLLTAMAQSFAWWTGSSVLYIFVQDHARQTMFDDIDLFRTIGYISQVDRILLDIGTSNTQKDILFTVKEQLRRMPNQGRTLEWLLRKRDNTLTLTHDELKAIPFADINFNYLGRVDQIPQEPFPYQQELNDAQYPESTRNHILDCKGGIREKQFGLVWEYSTDIHKQSTIEKVANYFIQSLRELIVYRTSIRMAARKCQ